MKQLEAALGLMECASKESRAELPLLIINILLCTFPVARQIQSGPYLSSAGQLWCSIWKLLRTQTHKGVYRLETLLPGGASRDIRLERFYVTLIWFESRTLDVKGQCINVVH